MVVIVQQILYHGNTWERVLVIAGITVLVYAVLLGSEFLVRLLVCAPTAIHSEQMALLSDRDIEIKNLAQAVKTLSEPKRTSAEEHHLREAETELKRIPEHAKMVLRHLWRHGELFPEPNGRFVVHGLTGTETSEALNGDLASTPFLKRNTVREMSGNRTSWEITPGFRDALGELLFPPQST